MTPSRRGIGDRLVGDVVVTARENGAALAIGNHVARRKEGLVAQRVLLLRIVVVRRDQAGSDTGRRHCRCITQIGCDHTFKLQRQQVGG